MSKEMKFGTKAIHAGVEPDPCTGAVMTPIYQTSTYQHKEVGKHKGYAYARGHNPTRDVLQNNLAALENGTHCLCFSSGMASLDSVIKLLSPGDEVIASIDLYGGSYRMFNMVFEKYNIKFHFVNYKAASNVEALITKNTKLMWIETPSNPLMQIIDIKAYSELAHKHHILMAVDNTMASPYLQNPLSLGADIVMHSVTKYLGGHSDLVMGALIVKDEKLRDKLFFIQNSCGGVPSPHDCFLALRGIKTLHLRMEKHCHNGEQVAQFLADHTKVKKVYWPGFKSHPNHEIAARQMRGFGGMVSFMLCDERVEKVASVMNNTSLFAIAESLGGVESLINHPATMTHASVPREQRIKNGLSDSLIRLSVGVEDGEDLIEDLDAALTHA